MSKKPKHHFGQRLKERRQAVGLSQDAAAQRIGVKMMTWSRWERGEHEPDLTTLVEICELLDVTPNDLLG